MLASALSGVDIALWDLRSRMAEQPLWRFLSANKLPSETHNGQVYLYGSGGLYGENKSTTDLTFEMREMQEKGFDLVKMKIGDLPIKEDLKRVRAVLAELPISCNLIIDGVYCYSVDEAMQLFNALPTHRIAAFQSPLNAIDIEGMQALTSADIPVMATEAEYRSEVHHALIDSNAVKYLQTAPIACGGITRLHELSDSISATPIRLSLEVSSTAIALLAACQFASADKRVTHTEYHFMHQVFFDELTLTPVPNRNGWFRLPDQPGLGLTIPTDAVLTQFTLGNI